MILLFNVFITDQSSTGGHWERLRSQGHIGVTMDRGNLKTSSKIDILKYTLASYAKCYPWKRAIIKIQLDKEYNSEQTKNDIKSFVEIEFKNIDLIFSDTRNQTQQDWIDTYSLINDDFIYYCCNHDHVALNSSFNYLEEIIHSIKKTYKDEYITLPFSHFSEAIRSAKCGNISHDSYVPLIFNDDYKIKDKYISYSGFSYDSINVISKNLYEDWFLKGKWDDILPMYPPNIFESGHVELSRIEGVGIVDLNFIRNQALQIPTPKQKIIIPYKEIARHFDGYFHQGITNDEVPSLDIPEGFFTNNIKIRYGYDDRKEGWININPKSEYYYASDKSGADYKFTLEELPLFWKHRISEIDVNPNTDEEELIQYRLKNIIEMIYTSAHVYPFKYHPYIDDVVKDKILNEYLMYYPQYQIQ
jgi:hypothetical protein